ncbi:MAG: serine hydrolase [Actinobacteria bacterium]|nr:serine hydrolase [Actinomycetota bacterium]
MAALPRIRPADAGLSSRAVLDLLDDVAASGIELHSLQVLRGGAVAVEGHWAPYRRELPHLLYSLSKSFTSTAIGFAVEEGRCSIDDRLVDLLAPWAPPEPSERVAAMTLRHALTMSTGHTIDPIFPVLGWTAEHPDGDWLTCFLDLEPGNDPGSIFTYDQLATYCLSRVITATTGERLLDYLRPRLLDPLGIDVAHWIGDRHGHDLGFSGLHVTPDAIARFGRLVADAGRWEGRQLVPAAWLAAATSPQVPNDRAHRAPGDLEANPDWMQGYGYQFWMCRRGYRADGALGQFCVVWPDEDVVIATTAATEDMQGLLDRFEAHLVPGLGTSTSGEDDRLAERLAGLTLTPAADVGGPAEVVAASNDGSGAARRLRSVTLRPDGDGWTLDLEMRAGSGALPVGRGRWCDGAWPADPPQPVATSGGWAGDGTFTADVAFLQSPHHLLLTIDPAAGTVSPRWPAFPLHGSDPADFAVG